MTTQEEGQRVAELAALPRDVLLHRLRRCYELYNEDEEVAHNEADLILLALINDAAVTEAFLALRRWYA